MRKWALICAGCYIAAAIIWLWAAHLTHTWYYIPPALLYLAAAICLVEWAHYTNKEQKGK